MQTGHKTTVWDFLASNMFMGFSDQPFAYERDNAPTLFRFL
jgi:hypothetical protein